MNSSVVPLLISTVITAGSILVAALSYRSLEGEGSGQTFALGRYTQSPSEYHLVDPSAPQRCLGNLSISVAPIASQTTLSLQGWILVGYNSHVEPLKLEATMIFNALGQLSVSLVRTSLANESFRLGTLGVNPISVQLYRNDGGDRPIFEYSIPGPVTISLQDGVYVLNAPPVPAFRGVPIPHDTRALPELSVLPASAETSCDIATAQHLDVGPLVRLADSLQRILPGGLAGL
jgi:hypothetical protein